MIEVKNQLEHRCWQCDRVLFFSDGEFDGVIRITCRRCRAKNVISRDGSQSRLSSLRAHASPISPDIAEILELMESRWQALAQDSARRKASLAVGLRFQVFMRDSFKCRYCGIGAEQGAILHADHVIPQSKGGPTSLDNLVTACLDCNLGKSDKPLN